MSKQSSGGSSQTGRRHLSKRALIVLGASVILQPAGAVLADTGVGWSWDPKTHTRVKTAVAIKGGATKPGAYTRKKLPGRMKSGQLAVKSQNVIELKTN